MHKISTKKEGLFELNKTVRIPEDFRLQIVTDISSFLLESVRFRAI